MTLNEFNDNGYNTNTNGINQVGVVIFLDEDENNCHFIQWPPKMGLRVVKPVLVRHAYAYQLAMTMKLASANNETDEFEV